MLAANNASEHQERVQRGPGKSIEECENPESCRMARVDFAEEARFHLS
jgi:hypothetical protein